MKYHLIISEKAVKQLKKLDKITSEIIISWIEKNLDGSESPRSKGKALTGSLTGTWRYRVGDYRVLAEINDGELIILVVEIRNRKNVYDR